MSSGVNVVSPWRERARRLSESGTFRHVVVPFFVIRAALVLVGVSASVIFPARQGFVSNAAPFVDVFIRWDAKYYLHVAAFGYDGTGDAFFPAYPFFVRALGVVLPLAYASVLFAQGMALVAFALLYRWVRGERGEEVAKRSVEIALLFPTSFFLGAAYAESTYLAFLLGAFVAHREGRLSLATWCVLGACLARPQGFLCATTPFVLAWLVRSRARRDVPWFVLSSVVALAMLLAIHQHATGDPLGFLHARTVRTLGVFREAREAPPMLAVLWDEGFGSNLVRRVLNVSALLLAGGGAVVANRRRRIEDATVLVMTLAVPLFFHHTIFDAASMARYVALAFPIYPLIAAWSLTGERRRGVDVLFAMAQVVLFAAYAGKYWAE